MTSTIKVKKMVRIEDIQEVIKDRPQEERDLLDKAYIYAARKHQGQLRISQEPYINHPLTVAYILAEKMNMDTNTVVAGLLHDTVEDTDATETELEEYFGKDVAFLVSSLTKIEKMEFKSKEEKQAENFRKMLLSMAEDVRVIIIKLADRLHNMSTLASLRDDKQKRIAQETLDIYAPLANRLGMAWMKWELEDLSFRILEYDKYMEISQEVKLNRTDRETYLEMVRGIVLKKLEDGGINADIAGRPKHFYSIYSKMKKKNLPFSEVFDLLALRVLVDTIGQCYHVLGDIHGLFTPIHSKFKDYVALPKSNMYQSLHTTVMGPHGHMVEFQIRTREMHRIAEEGVAAHWKYKEGKAFDPKSDKQFVWLRQLVEQKEPATEIIQSLKEDILTKQMFIYTPQGDSIELPQDSTPLDFAYAIHSKVGDRCVGAKVNGRMVNLKYRLRNGEKVEIITNTAQEPKSDWLNFVKTTRAKSRIRAYLRKKDSERAIAGGTEKLEKEFQLKGVKLKEFIIENQENLNKVLDRLHVHDLEELFAKIGFGKLSPLKVVHIFFPSDDKGAEDNQLIVGKSKTSKEPFSIDGVDGMMTNIAKCCTPLPGDEVMGYISTGRGIIVHQKDCPNLLAMAINEDRLVPVKWELKNGYIAPAKLRITTKNLPGGLSAMTAIMADMGINISAHNHKGVGKESEHTFSVDVRNKEELERLINRLDQLENVKTVRKV